MNTYSIYVEEKGGLIFYKAFIFKDLVGVVHPKIRHRNTDMYTNTIQFHFNFHLKSVRFLYKNEMKIVFNFK